MMLDNKASTLNILRDSHHFVGLSEEDLEGNVESKKLEPKVIPEFALFIMRVDMVDAGTFLIITSSLRSW